MKQYKIHKDRPWAKSISNDHLYQVFQCFSEDQIFFYEQFEFTILERRIDDLRQDEREESAAASSDGLESYYSRHSDGGTS